ncbi:MAG TPA: SAM-dependent methyltransferase [Clostridiales bacterium]|nr:SAM-dependent methyltransferase [Clostridiales bacterium]
MDHTANYIEQNPSVALYPDDTLEDLQRAGFQLIQKKRGFRFGLDSVLLAAYAASFYAKTPTRRLCVADLGVGCGAVSLLLAARLPNAQVTGLEIDSVSCETFERNIRLNHLENRFKAVQGDIRDLAAGKHAHLALSAGSFDLVISNPPYETFQPTRRQAESEEWQSRRRAREETDLSLSELIQAASRLLRSGGRLVLVHQMRRLPDIFCVLRNFGLEAKTMRPIETLPGKSPVTVLISALRDGRPGGFAADAPLLICSKPGVWSAETALLYGLEKSVPDEKKEVRT